MAVVNLALKKTRFNAFERGGYAQFANAAERQEYLNDAYRLPSVVASEKPAFSVRCFRSGEISGAYFLSGASSKVKPPIRSGPVVTTEFSQRSKSKIRRAVENSSQALVSFLTLTFAPWDRSPWEIERYSSRVDGVSAGGSVLVSRSRRFALRGRRPSLVPRVFHRRRRLNVVVPIVRQDFAKHRLKNLRSALTMKVNRQISCKLRELPVSEHAAYTAANKFRLIWVAELHDNGNIHFHALTNKYWAKKYLAKVWSYGQTNIKKITDSNHAANYMTKYLSKAVDNSISGNRYNISQNLRTEAKPMIFGNEDTEAIESRKLLHLMKKMVEDRGGRVIDSGFGFNLPRPRRSRVYRDEKTGTIKKTKACGSLPGDKVSVHQAFMDTVFPCREAHRHSGPVPF